MNKLENDVIANLGRANLGRASLGRANLGRASATWAAALVAGFWVGGCSLILDPDNCSDDTECNGGTCNNGICTGAELRPDGDAEDVGGAGGAGGEPVPDVGPDQGGAGGEIDLGPPADAGPEASTPQRPRCEVVAPGPTARVVGVEQLPIAVRITDTDTPPANLTVTVGTAADPRPVTLAADGTGSADVPVAAGLNRYTLRAVDPDGLECSVALTVEGDFTAPVLALTRPLSGESAVRANPFQIEGTATDRTPVRTLEVQVGGVVVPVAPAWRENTFTTQITLADGANAVQVVAVDVAGNRSNVAQFSVFLDQIAPTLQLIEPVDGARSTAITTDIRGVVLDGAGPDPLAQVTVTLDGPQAGQRDQRRGVPVDAAGAFLVPDVTLFRGENRIEACARDVAGNNTCVVHTVTREDATPCVNLESPLADSFVSQRDLVVRGSVCAVVDTLTLSVAGGAALPVPLTDNRFEVPTALPGPGAHELVLRGTTADGQSAQVTARVTVDESPPSLRLTRPVARECVNGEAVEICGTASDGESRVAYIEAGTLRLDQPDETFCLTLSDLDEGFDQTLRVRAFNGAGAVAEQSLLVDVDSVAPVVTLDVSDNWMRPDGAGRAVVAGSVDVGFCGMVNNTVQVTVAGSTQNAGVDGNSAFRNARVVADGEYGGQVVARDRAGHTTTVNFTLRIDGTAPVLDDLRPPPPRLVDGAVAEVSARVSDGAGSGLAFASINGVEVPVELGRIRRSVPVANGATEVTFLARDRAGNETRQVISVFRDVLAPTVSITSPAANAPVPAPLVATGTVTDDLNGSGVARVTVNGVVATVNPDGTWRAVGVPIDPAAPGLSVVATDQAGNATDPPLTRPVQLQDFAVLDPALYGLAGAQQTGFVAVADLNNDGRLDVAALSDQVGGVTRVFLQTAGGAFTSLTAAQAGLPAGPVAGLRLADFTGDGRADLLLWGPGRLDVLPGNGTGGFGAPVDNLPDLLVPNDVVVGDVNRDGQLDVLILAGLDTRFYLGTGGGVFQPELLGLMGLGGVETDARGVFADFGGDGLLDLVTAGPAGLRFWAGLAASPAFAVPVAVPNGLAAADRLVVFDVNRDGTLDLLATAGADARLFTSNGGANLASSDRSPPWSADGRAFAFGDLDNDTRDDGVVVGTAGLGLFGSLATGHFEFIDPAPPGLPDFGSLRAVDVVDLDGDGDLDLVLGGPAGLTIVRSNRRLTADQRFVILNVRRSLVGNPGPADGLGAVIYQNIEGGAAPERALPVRPVGPTTVSIGAGRNETSVEVRYVDRGPRGRYIQDLGSIQNAQTLTVNDLAN